MWRGVAATHAAALVFVPSAVLAQAAAAPDTPPIAVAADAPRSASLSWVRLDGASTCATATEIAEGVASILKRDALVAESRAVMAVEARVERIPGKKRFRATIDISSGDGRVKGTRKLESAGDDCRKLDAPAALAIALMIDPDALHPGPPPPPPQPMVVVKRDILVVPVPVFIEKPAPPPPPPPPPSAMAPELTLSLGPSFALGLVPGPAPGVRFGVEYAPPDALGEGERVTVGPPSLRLAFAAYGGSIEVEGEAVDQNGALEMVAVLPQLAACPATLWIGSRASFAGCVALDVGAVMWSADSFDSDPRTNARPFVAVGPIAQTRLVLAGPLALEIRGAAVVPLVRDTFEYRLASGTNAIAYQPGAVGATFDVALALGLGL